VKLGYYSSNDPPTLSSIADDVEDTLFKSILRNAQHVLHPYLEERPQLHYNLRNRPGVNKTLIEKTVNLNNRYFLVCKRLKSATEPTAIFTQLLHFLFSLLLCYFTYYVLLVTTVLCNYCNSL